MQGFGTFFNKKGEFYQGEWKAGKRYGKGRQTYGGRPVSVLTSALLSSRDDSESKLLASWQCTNIVLVISPL